MQQISGRLSYFRFLVTAQHSNPRKRFDFV